jgi:lysophospholipase L1-like esterase
MYPHLTRFSQGLPRLTDALESQRKIKVVAIGSSSTQGVVPVKTGVPVLPYPPRLEMLLRRKYFGRLIDVTNRGISGQEAPEEISRFQPDVFDESPSLVIWQVGTNAVYKDYSPDEVKAAIRAGLKWLKAKASMDVVLMDFQYTQAMLGKKLPQSIAIEKIISDAAAEAGVNLFNRFALMKQWVDDKVVASVTDLDDGADEHLHTGEWATSCISRALFEAIAGKLDAAGVT